MVKLRNDESDAHHHQADEHHHAGAQPIDQEPGNRAYNAPLQLAEGEGAGQLSPGPAEVDLEGFDPYPYPAPDRRRGGGVDQQAQPDQPPAVVDASKAPFDRPDGGGHGRTSPEAGGLSCIGTPATRR